MEHKFYNMANKAKNEEQLDCKPNGFEQAYDKFAESKQPKKVEYLTTKVYEYLNSEKGEYFQKSWLHETILKMFNEKKSNLIDIVIADERHVFTDITEDNFEKQFNTLFTFAEYATLNEIDTFEDDSDLMEDIKFFFKKDKKLFATTAVTIMKASVQSKYGF